MLTPKTHATPSLSASSAILYEPSSQTFLCEKNADCRLPMASTTKIMTALVAIENTSLTDVVEVAPEAVGVEGSSVYLTEGEKVTVETLLYAILLQSANDAAAAIAIAVGGSIEGFANLMNERAMSLGLTDTHFVNPHGLHHGEHYTTARELALIAAEAMKNPTFKSIVSTKQKTLSLQDGSVSRVIQNHNRLLRFYEDAIGIKTGFTKNSGRCLVGAAERDGVMLITVTLNAPNDWNDHQKLFDHGFENFVHQTIANAESYTLTLPVLGGKKNQVTLTNASALSATAPLGAHIEIVAELNQKPLSAPIKRGMHLGSLCAYYKGTCLSSVPLIATENIEAFKARHK